MTVLDYVILGIVVIGAINGFRNGLLRELASLLGLIIGFVAARAMYTSLADELEPVLGTSTSFTQIAAFIAIWLIIPILFMLFASFVTRALDAIKLGWLNKLLGLAVGAVIWVVVIGAIANVLDRFDKDGHLVHNQWKKESVLYNPLKTVASSIFPEAKNFTEKLFNHKYAERRIQGSQGSQ